MKKIIISILLFSIFINWTTVQTHGISAQSAIILDANTLRILYSENAQQQMGMASTTKIMTAICAIENGNLAQTVTVSPKAYGVEGSSMYLALEEKITLENLLWGLMLVSGNDAATAIAVHISGSEEKFAELMNETARKIGATKTRFTNPHGLSHKEHYTTAHDLAKITAYALKLPKFREIVSTKTKSIPHGSEEYNRQLVNHNKFLNMYDGCIGVKTGFTKATGRCLVTAVEKNGMTLVCVTLNAPDDWNDHKTLYDNAFSKYSPFVVFESNTIISTADIANGETEKLSLTVSENITLPLSDGEFENLSVNVSPYTNLCAPISAGDTAGEITITTDDGFCVRHSLVAAENVPLKKNKAKSESIHFFQSLQMVFSIWIKTFV